MKNKLLQNFTKSSQNLCKNYPLIMRDYIEHKLYYENEAYYSNQSQIAKSFLPIGRLDKPLNFINMRGLSDYAKELHLKYPKSTWLTVSELLRPYFGYAVGNYILTQHLQNKNRKNIKIVEIGSGMGGAIESVLDYLKKFNIKEYKEIEYYGLEMTESLCQQTENLLKLNHPDLYNNNQIHLINKSLYDYDESNIIDDDCFVLAFNLLDSIGHDKIKFENKFEKVFLNELKEFYMNDKISVLNRRGEDFREFLNSFLGKFGDLVKETHVEEVNGKMIQIYKNLNDEKIKEMLFYYLMPYEEKSYILGEDFLRLEKSRTKQYEEWFVRLMRKIFNFSLNNNTVWLPTQSIQLFTTINKVFPNHKLILLDFDFLPSKLFNSDYKGKNAPGVYSIKENSYDSITHPSIFSNYDSIKKPVNIYFPVDFELMQIIYKLNTNKTSSVNKFKYFMSEYSMSEWCETRTGFNPLTDTHHNLSFLLTLN